MKKKIIFFLILITGFIYNLKAQDILVIDMETGFPIDNVTVKSIDDKFIFHTNKEGIVNIRNFKKKDTLIFEHPLYESFKIVKRVILKNNYTVELIKRYQKLDNVILSVSRTKTKKKNVAKQVKVIDYQETLKVQPGTAADLLEDAGNIVVQKTQGGAGSPIIRGLEANRILLVIDGVRLNNAISRTGHLHTAITVNPLILNRTEIIYGPSAIYGSDALGGVINFYTKTPIINNYKTLSGGAIGRYATATDEVSFNFNTDLSFKKWATSLAVSYSDFGNIRMGSNRLHGYKNWGIVDSMSTNTENYYDPHAEVNPDKNIQPNTAFQQKDFFNKSVVSLGDDNEFIFELQLNQTSEVDRFDKLTETKDGHLRYAEWRYGPSQRLLISPQLWLNFDTKWLKKAKIILSFQDIDESRISRKFGSLTREYKEENVKVYSLNADFNTHFSKSRILSYGLEVTYNDVKSKAYSKELIVDGHQIIGYNPGPPVPTRYPDGGSHYSSFAAYSNYKLILNKRSSLNAGIRFTQTYVSVMWKDQTFITLPYNVNELANFAFTGDISYIFTPKNWKFSLLGSSGFRSPNVDDIGKIREKHGKVMVPNIYLKPEYAYTGEAAITRYFNNKKFNISLDGYYSYLYHYIGRDKFELQPGQTQILYDGEMVETYANVNLGDAVIYGGSVTIEGKLNRHFMLDAGIFYTKGTMLDQNRPLPSIPPLYGGSKLTYKLNHFETALQYRFMLDKPANEYDIIGGVDNIEESPIDPITGAYVGFPKWQILNWYNTYHFNKNITLNFAVENIFDVHYKEFASAISAPGRNFKIQIVTKF
ncbi:MAG TPA: TonB-dependent receptor [Flavobacteriales bacterium]|nr:TonB-dependent receptor [Flavobacteriales bacterium]